MTEIIMYNSLDLAIILGELLVCTIVFAIVKGWYDNKRWEKHIYKILEEYRAKYGVDEGWWINEKIEELRRLGYSDEYINKKLGHLVNWRI